MVVHEYEGDMCKGNACGFPQAEVYNLVVSADLGNGRRCCIHALTDEEVAEGSVALELLRTSALILGLGTPTAEAAPVAVATALAEETPTPVRSARRYGVHQHPEVGTGSGAGCVGSSHHASCETLFGGIPETGCTLILGSSPQTWNCVHDDTTVP